MSADSITTVVIDQPWRTRTGAWTARVVAFDAEGHEIGWFGIDEADDDYAPSAEHPDREHLGWAPDHPWVVALYDNVNEAWACPSWEAAVEAVLYEHALRLSDGWYQDNAPCHCVA
jgi:hypothetical protein